MKAIGCISLMMGLGMSVTSVDIVRESTLAFNERNYEKLFSDYYADNLEIKWHPDWQAFAKAIEVTKNKNLNTEEKKQQIDSLITSVPSELAFENIEAIRAQIKKQFESEEDLAAEILELEGIGPFALLHQRKTRLGETVEGYILYYIVEGRIENMWMAKR